MDPTDRQAQLRHKLIDYDVQRVSFHDAKQMLLEEGYTDDEISLAVASQPFDGKVNEKREVAQDAADTEAAQVMGEELLQHEDDMDTQKRRGDLAMAEAASNIGKGINPYSAQASMSVADDIGFPLARALLLLVFLSAVVYGANETFHFVHSSLALMLNFAVLYAGAILTAITLMSLLRELRHLRRRKRSLIVKGLAVVVALVYLALNFMHLASDILPLSL